MNFFQSFHIQVAQMTILPKGKIAMVDDNESKMLSSESKKNAYFFDYTIKAEKQPKVRELFQGLNI